MHTQSGSPQKGASRWERYLFAALTALEFLMSFTFLGYIHIEPISITIAYLPILIAGCFLGVGASTAMGFFFGLSSLYKATAYYVMPLDKVFSPFLSGSPLGSLVLSIGMRALFGFLIGALFAAGKRTRHPRVCLGLISLFAPKLHSLLVYAAMGLLFPELGRGVATAFRIGVSDVLLAVLCALVIELLWFLLRRREVQGFRAFLERSRRGQRQGWRFHCAWALLLLGILCAAIASTFYFAQRMSYMLGVHGLSLSYEAGRDLLHLQVQSLLATAALSFLLVLCLLAAYQYLSYREYVGQLDAVTGIMGRKMFNRYCEEALKDMADLPAGSGWFLFVDVDYFKSINDTLGHPVGDLVLKRIAQTLTEIFAADGGIGRMGGDEFAVLLAGPMPKEELCGRMDAFLSAISAILDAPETVSCSIGACRFESPQELPSLYAQTDRLLYAAKRHGRACYIMGSLQGGELRLFDA
ncbi:MAG TPA: diguanylate cyclase [Candidatus Pullichristensenella stercoripullorum]|nr:diguanylate cyclase [Candidatus Pullichristensenella stercoripullorum]